MTRSKVYRGLLVGAGYFSQFHLDAWARLDGVNIVCVCDLDEKKSKAAAEQYQIDESANDLSETLDRGEFDFVDLATPPAGRLELIELIAAHGLPIICQKPVANDFRTVQRIAGVVEDNGIEFMVHENFRFQPWYREIKSLLDGDAIGDSLHTIHMRTRLGDGWGQDAYLGRQPYFRTMPRLLIHETGIHFVDTFRYLGGEIEACHADLRRLNNVIVGEDAGTIQFWFENGARAIWDANRYNESLAENPRYTFGELLVEADKGSIWLDSNGTITIKRLGEPPEQHDYSSSTNGFAGDCVFKCFEHFLDVLDKESASETSLSEYLKSLRVVEAIYESARTNRTISLADNSEPAARRIVDLSLPTADGMRGVGVSTAKRLDTEGWNATTLTLYSHAGTHMDAPRHFLPDGQTLDQLDLAVCCGPARVVNLAPIEPRHLITVNDIESQTGEIFPGERLLLRTDWHRRLNTPEYRDDLPRISIELARWLVDKQVALIGVEPPSVADVNNLEELTEVHQTLFRGGVRIVEGLAHLDQLTQPVVEFIALPLKFVDGDGCPVRAVALQETAYKFASTARQTSNDSL